jgi:hypothetical protein
MGGSGGWGRGGMWWHNRSGTMFPCHTCRGAHGAMAVDVVCGDALRSVFATSDNLAYVNLGATVGTPERNRADMLRLAA